MSDGAEPGGRVEPVGDRLGRRLGDVDVTVVDNVDAAAPRGALDEHRPVRQVLRPVGAHEHDRDRAVGLEAAVELAERIDDPAAREVVVHRHRLAHHCPLVVERVRPAEHGDAAEVFAGRAVLQHVGARRHRDFLRRRDDAGAVLELHVPRQAPAAALPEPLSAGARAAVERPVARPRSPRLRPQSASVAWPSIVSDTLPP